ncbi:MAG: cupredoxin family protein [Betaproteobacteria bacterium]
MERKLWLLSAVVMMLSAGQVAAHGDAKHDAKKPAVVKKEQKSWGIAGDAKAVTRTVKIEMLDTMRFSPDRIEVKQGETIRFVHTNQGKVMHEFVLGTKKELDEHAALMVKFPTMEHDEPYMVHVASGKLGEIVWTFNRAGNFDFACLIPGHYQAGMVGKVLVAAK